MSLGLAEQSKKALHRFFSLSKKTVRWDVNKTKIEGEDVKRPRIKKRCFDVQVTKNAYTEKIANFM